MAYFRVRGSSITLLHGVRAPGRGVRQRRIWTFSGVAELRRWLAPDAWAALQIQVEQRHPELAIDWAKVRQQAVEMVATEKSPGRRPEDRLKRLRRALVRLQRELPDGRRPDDRDVARSLGPLLRQVARRAILLYDSYPAPNPDLAGWLEAVLPDPESTESLVEQGRDLLASGRAKGAVFFARARRIDPYDPDIDNSEGIGWLEQGNLEEAERKFQEARDLALCQLPDRKRAWSWSNLEVRPYVRATNNLGLVRIRQGRHQEALELFEECLRRCPDDGVGARFHLGTLHHRLGNLHRALEFHRENTSGNLVDTPDPLFDVGNVLLQLNRPREAVTWLLRGVAMNRHIPALLLKPPRRWPGEDAYSSVDSRNWAISYVRDHADLWTAQSLAFLEQLSKEREVRGFMRLLKDLEDELADLPPGDGRSEALQRLDSATEAMTSGESVPRVQERLAAWWEARPS